MTATFLGITPEERKALISFVESPILGNNIALNGEAHHYDQCYAQDDGKASETGCGTAGCVAGYVFAHVTHVQGKKKLRDAKNADGYIVAASRGIDWYTGQTENKFYVPMLEELYTEGNEQEIVHARKVVTKMLQTGEVSW